MKTFIVLFFKFLLNLYNTVENLSKSWLLLLCVISVSLFPILSLTWDLSDRFYKCLQYIDLGCLVLSVFGFSRPLIIALLYLILSVLFSWYFSNFSNCMLSLSTSILSAFLIQTYKAVNFLQYWFSYGSEVLL